MKNKILCKLFSEVQHQSLTYVIKDVLTREKNFIVLIAKTIKQTGWQPTNVRI